MNCNQNYIKRCKKFDNGVIDYDNLKRYILTYSKLEAFANSIVHLLDKHLSRHHQSFHHQYMNTISYLLQQMHDLIEIAELRLKDPLLC